MPKILLILFIISFTKSFGQTFSPIEIRADLAFLKERIEEIHPNPYKFIEQSRFQQIYDSLYRVERSLTIKQTFVHYLNLTRSIHCGHSSIFVDERLIPPSNSNPKFLPLDVVIYDGRVFISRNYSENHILQKGIEIIDIEDIPMNRLLKNLSRYTFQNGDGVNAEVDNYYLQRNFRKLLYLFFEEQDELHLKVRLANKQEKSTNIMMKPLAYLREIEAERNPVKNVDFYKNIYLSDFDSKTSLLKIRSFDGNEFENGNFRNEISTIFKKLAQKQSKNLIIDVRNNVGGGLDYADEILKYLLQKPYQRYQVSNSPNIKVKKKGLSASQFYEPTNEFLFRGNIYVWVNEGTFSTAVYLAAHLKNQANVSLIGTTCGGAADGSSAGEFTSFTLPNTKFTVSLPLLKINYNTTSALHLQPNFEVKQSLSDFLTGEDSVVLFTKELLKGTKP
ncbi:peptidase S41 [Emticicia oligotrophica DSM 17448]|uniref:Peptidase S41 n=1 Tax=Emticicia oligotrophica (strain DSM 17448 / CIP 109782 / MTCC 6937 / GPTSA100-15) TaxID=929562 RepID=A0ABN4AM44_EMTOG|nr:S41 family peptidase [Emticicia oligotrophica]AFK03250.1 peptidase S41 [Emticicia oligotrophica DSM 17448]